jgi:hypothetical protein
MDRSAVLTYAGEANKVCLSHAPQPRSTVMPSAPAPAHSLRLQVTCTLPCRPDSPPFEFGVQEGRDTLHPGKTGADGRITFEAVVAAVQRADGSVRYRGSFVHGPSTEQILYLSVRPVGANPTQWARRVKVRLPVLTWDELAGCTTRRDAVWRANNWPLPCPEALARRPRGH